MPDVQEVFRMATQKVRPDPGALDRQLKGQRTRTLRRKAGAFALVAALVGAAAIVAVASLPDDRESDRTGGTGISPSVSPAAIPDVAFALDLDTGTMTPLPPALTRRADIGSLGVAPAGELIAFNATDDGGTTQVFVAKLDGTDIRQVTHVPEGAGGTSWSADGSRIAYASPVDGGTQNVFVMDLGGGRPTQVTFEDCCFLGTYQISPDGSSLIYTMDRGDGNGGRVRIVPLAGGKGRSLVNPGAGDAGDGLISPDGRYLSYGGDDLVGGPANRWLADADGDNPRLLVEGNFPSASWSPDSTRLAYWSYPGHEVFVLDIASGESTKVTEGAWPVWLDDHTLMVEPDSGL